MKRIFKYDVEQTYQLPEGYRILDVQVQSGRIVLWALVDDSVDQMLPVRFEVYGTGFDMPDREMKYLATVQSGIYVWHVWQSL